MSLDLDRIPDKLLRKLYGVRDLDGAQYTEISNLIREAYTEGLTLGLAGAHDTVVYRAVVDYIVPEHKDENS